MLCGTAWFDEVFRQIDPRVRVTWSVHDGDRVRADQQLCTLDGPARSLLTGERTALNFLQSLSATATVTRRYVDAVAGTKCRILDTRKTIPGPAPRAEVRGALRRRHQSPHRSVRRDPGQGEPHRRGGLDRERR